ncbi:MAG: 4-hydroxy-3-methylbut-2-enyl diphosphate reductase [Planctomycetaceae bacterium]
MKVIKAEAMGFCFGVRDAIDVAQSIENPEDVTIHGELVHNPMVLHQLQTKGFASSPEADRPMPATDEVLVTAHGISDRERNRLNQAGKKLIDTTCPLVSRVHRAAQTFDRQDYLVLVIGRPGHVEVQGIVEDLKDYVVVPSVESVRFYAVTHIGIVCQTTMPPDTVEEIRTAISAKNPETEIRFVNTVCQPTLDRQAAVDRLANLVELVVVVGGNNSNNTRQLVRRVQSMGSRAIHIESAADLVDYKFYGVKAVGLTAGTSTPDSVIEEVYSALSAVNEKRPALQSA